MTSDSKKAKEQLFKRSLKADMNAHRLIDCLHLAKVFMTQRVFGRMSYEGLFRVRNMAMELLRMTEKPMEEAKKTLEKDPIGHRMYGIIKPLR